jgi:hypothetical protein
VRLTSVSGGTRPWCPEHVGELLEEALAGQGQVEVDQHQAAVGPDQDVSA